MNEGSDDVDDGLARTEKGKECLENVFCKIKQRYVLT